MIVKLNTRDNYMYVKSIKTAMLWCSTVASDVSCPGNALQDLWYLDQIPPQRHELHHHGC